MNEWLDRHMGRLFLAPAVTLILIFSIFPLVASLILAFSRIRFSGGGFKVRAAGWRNFEKQFFGSEQFHLIGTFTQISILGWIFGLTVTGLMVWWIVKYARTHFTWFGFVGRVITLLMTVAIAWLFAGTLLRRQSVRNHRYDAVLCLCRLRRSVPDWVWSGVCLFAKAARQHRVSCDLLCSNDDHPNRRWLYLPNDG